MKHLGNRPGPDQDEFLASMSDLIPRIHRGFLQEERHALSEGILTLPQFWAIQQIHSHESCTMHELARALRIPPSGATQTVDRLSCLGLVKRKPDPEDRRAIRVHLTAKGDRTLKSILRQRLAISQKVFASISAADRPVFLKVMEQIADQLSPERQEGPS